MSYDYSESAQPPVASPKLLPNPPSSGNQSNTVTMEKIGALLDQKLNSTLSTFMEDFRQALRNDVKAMIHEEINVIVKQLKDEFTTTTDFICDLQTSMRRELDEKCGLIKTLENELLSLRKDHNLQVYNTEAISKLDRYHPALVVDIEFRVTELEPLKPNVSTRLNFKKSNFNNIKADLEGVNWKEELKYDDIDMTVEKFYTIVNGILSKYTPFTRKHSNNMPGWFSPALVRSLREKSITHRRKHPQLFDQVTPVDSRLRHKDEYK
ncbi:hypothetical protein ACJJTC_002137 [Scirpophaga incertulas]